MTAAATFMAPQAQKPEALPWLARAPKGRAPAWAQALRATGAEAFAATGLPTPAWEGWQHTNLRPLAQALPAYTEAPVKFDTARLPAPLLANAARLVIVNGQYQPQLSTSPPGVTVTPLLDAPDIGTWTTGVGDLAAKPLKALNAAHLRDGLVLEVAGEVARPLEILFCNSSGAIHPRLACRLAPNASLTLVERHCGEGAYFANHVSHLVLERDSRLKFYRFMDEAPSAFHISLTEVRQHKNTHFEGFSMARGGLVAREEFAFDQLDEHVFTGISGIYMLQDRQNHDFTITATHFEPYGKSEQFFKGVADAQARAVFQGKIQVRHSAQKAEGRQSHHALLLSRTAEACAKPELEIFADDVKCGHGATSGHLDPVALFYLRSRGIPEAEAKALLIESFLNEAALRVTDEDVREVYRQQVAEWLKQRRS